MTVKDYPVSIMFDAESPEQAASRLREIADDIERGYRSGPSWNLEERDMEDD